MHDAPDSLPAPDFARRRSALAAALESVSGAPAEDCAVVLFSPPVAMRNSDVDHPFRADSDLYWLTGFSEPEATFVYTPSGSGDDTTLFLRPRDPVREAWEGRRLGIERAPEALGLDRAREVSSVREQLPALLFDRPHVFTLLDRFPNQPDVLFSALSMVRARSRRVGRHPFALYDLAAALHPLRLQKDDADVAALRRAVEISASGHRRAMSRARPGMNERALEAELAYAFAQGGSPRHGYSPIVAGGANACILHYVENDAPIADDALVLIDAGAEMAMMSGDITRTWPLSGRFTPAQKDVYDVVLAANLAAIDVARPGQPYSEIDTVARRTLAEGLVSLGLLAGEVDGLVEKVRGDDDPPWAAGKAPLDRFYPHSTGHWLGMDVHDVGAYHDGKKSTELLPSMTLTVEPGIYLDGDDVPETFRGIGIRIEDDILVTADGPQVLSASVPKSVEEIETLVGSESEAS